MNGSPVREYPEEWEFRGHRDPLSPSDRASMAPFRCETDSCGALLMSLEVGPHYRAKHPDDAPRVTRR
jgi:hypothetical protein